MSADRNRQVTLSFYDAHNQHDVDAIAALLADDMFAAVVPEELGIGQDRHALIRYVPMTFEAFPDAHIEVLDLVADEQMVATRARFTGTNEGELMGLRPLGKAVEEEYGEFLRFDDDGKMVALFAYYDNLSLMQQMGVLPKGGERIARGLTAVRAALRRSRPRRKRSR